MDCKIQLVMCTDDGREASVPAGRTLTQDGHRLEPLGLARADAKPLRTRISPPRLAQQRDAFRAAHACGAPCGSACKVTGGHTRTGRT